MVVLVTDPHQSLLHVLCVCVRTLHHVHRLNIIRPSQPHACTAL